MPIMRNIAIEIDAADLLRHEGGLDNEMVVQTAAWAIQQCRQLAAPVLTYRFLPIGGLTRKELIVGQTTLAIGPMAKLLQGATEVLLGVVTLGPALEEAVKGLNAVDKMLEAYLLDMAGVTALFQAAKQFEVLAETRAAAQRWGVGAVLSPGALAGWPLEEQKTLCALLDLASIQVTLSPSAVLLPYKSMSVLIGLGPGYGSCKVQQACRHCALKKTCRYQVDSCETT